MHHGLAISIREGKMRVDKVHDQVYEVCVFFPLMIYLFIFHRVSDVATDVADVPASQWPGAGTSA